MKDTIFADKLVDVGDPRMKVRMVDLLSLFGVPFTVVRNVRGTAELKVNLWAPWVRLVGFMKIKEKEDQIAFAKATLTKFPIKSMVFLILLPFKLMWQWFSRGRIG